MIMFPSAQINSSHFPCISRIRRKGMTMRETAMFNNLNQYNTSMNFLVGNISAVFGVPRTQSMNEKCYIFFILSLTRASLQINWELC